MKHKILKTTLNQIKSSYLLKIYIIALFESSHEYVEIKHEKFFAS